MSHKTAYSTFSNPDLGGLETQVNDFIKSLHKNEHHEDIKVHDITTFNVRENFIAAVTYSFAKKKISFEIPFEPAKNRTVVNFMVKTFGMFTFWI